MSSAATEISLNNKIDSTENYITVIDESLEKKAVYKNNKFSSDDSQIAKINVKFITNVGKNNPYTNESDNQTSKKRKNSIGEFSYKSFKIIN